MITISNKYESMTISHIKLFEMHMDILKKINPILCDIYKIIITDLSTFSWLNEKLHEGELKESDRPFMNIFSCLMDITMEYVPYHIHQFVFNSSDDNEFSPDFCESLFLEMVELGELNDTCSKLQAILLICREHKTGLTIINNGDKQ